MQKDAKSEPLAQQVLAEMKTGVSTRVSPTLTSALGGKTTLYLSVNTSSVTMKHIRSAFTYYHLISETMQDAAQHLATVATGKGILFLK